ncbi:N-acetylmuramoyl-L-alanine amidase [Bacillus sp. EB600]|uniref:N-acetylmuramoyl-L-alanine amidase n=1 Tax=Bacillus sp. EB600 TaxID=2806345 RepID=UPI002109F2B6|nr:N-acetylmuramoyl-L-alanine amidase [Bacillus sp. EB600]MCQ6282685.1 N-acetylmuramoyl-L-alanine amidase [Bacillus sp. EB600]
MIKTQIKNVRLMKVLPILSVILLPLLIILPQKDQTAYANTSTSQVTVLASNHNGWEAADISSKILDPTENREAIVEAMVLNIRENPSLSSHIVGKLKSGTKITVHEEQGGWAKVVTSSGIEGWVYDYYITKDAPSVPPTSTERMQNSHKPLKGKTIVLDPGHGGIDDGTTSIVGTPEKTLTLATAKVVEQKLKNAGANVIMTRTNDTYISLQQRADLSNHNYADAFISFHYNWTNDPSANGLTDFYYQTSKDTSLAAAILNEVVKTTRLHNIGTRFDDLGVLRNNFQPSTLIELGFLSNKQDDAVVESPAYRNNVAQGVYLGLLDYYSIKK